MTSNRQSVMQCLKPCGFERSVEGLTEWPHRGFSHQGLSLKVCFVSACLKMDTIPETMEEHCVLNTLGGGLWARAKKWQTPVQECQVQSLVCPREDQEQEVTVNALLATKSDHVLSAKLHLLSAKCFSCVWLFATIWSCSVVSDSLKLYGL